MAKRLSRKNLSDDPLQQFALWYRQAVENVPGHRIEPHAMTLATCSKSGTPSIRTVLMKDFSDSGFIFFTNYSSRKAKQLAENSRAALLFYWSYMGRQVRIEGTAEKLSATESDSYFYSRPRLSRIGAVASPQSQPIESRRELISRFRRISSRFRGRRIERPSHWGGYIVIPRAIEFWQAGSHRLHDSFRYDKDGNVWRLSRLAP
ncbi:MAG: pyridoxamine 5'-phosphate oxidase [Chitinivibrionales bacterium]